MSKLSFNLDEKVVVVTGGSRGIGLEIAKMLLKNKTKTNVINNFGMNALHMVTYKMQKERGEKKELEA